MMATIKQNARPATGVIVLKFQILLLSSIIMTALVVVVGKTDVVPVVAGVIVVLLE